MPTNNSKRSSKKDVRKKDGKRKIVFVSLLVLCILVGVVYYYVFIRQTVVENLITKGVIPGTNDETGNLESQAKDSSTFGIAKAELKWDSIAGRQTLKAVIEKIEGKDPENIIYQYQWTINKKPAGDNNDSISGFKRNDTVAVKITPYEGDKAGSFKLLTLFIQNTPPLVTAVKELKIDGKDLSYQIVATDPDGDTLLYELLDPPEGMVIDNKTGIINWQIKDSGAGLRTVKVKVSDGNGGEAMWSIDATVEKKTQETVKSK